MLIDNWIKTKIGLNKADTLTREKLNEYQLFKLGETINYARNNSSFYNEYYKNNSMVQSINSSTTGLDSFSDLSNIPFTTPNILKEQGERMICVPQSLISRIVTLNTTGSTGSPKRVFFTEEDQELTKDYFHYGMRVMINPDDVFLILLPCKTPGSVGDLLREGVERDGTKTIPFGYPNPDLSQDEEVLRIIKDNKVTSIVGTPPVVARLAKLSNGFKIRTALMAAEYVSSQNVNIIEKNWGCQVFEHYGMTEMGLGGAMACKVHEGYHPREADLFIEIIDPKTGKHLTDGLWGEIVFTTLTRKGMPLIRYRTGDISRWINEPCPCGSLLRRLDRVKDRGVIKGY